MFARFAWIGLPLLVVLLNGCNGALVTQGPHPHAATPTPLPPTSASLSYNVSGSGGKEAVGVDGYSGVLSYPMNNNLGATADFGFAGTAAVASPAPVGTPIAIFAFNNSAAIEYVGAFVVTPIVIPDTISLANQVFTESLYDETKGTVIGVPSTGTVKNQVLTFPDPSGGNFVSSATDTYAFVILSNPK